MHCRISCELPHDAHRVTQASMEPGDLDSRNPPKLVQACNCEERLTALESELADLRCVVRELSQKTTSRVPPTTLSNRNTTASVPEITSISHEILVDHTAAARVDPPVAPVRVIRKMYTWINGNPETPKDVIELPESTRAQLASNDLGVRLIETKDLHTSLYGILKSGLAKLSLESPLSLPSLYAMLLTCLLNLNLGYSDSFIDAWLLSGSLILQLMLSLDFPVQQQTPLSLRYTEDDRNRILTWNAACLQHLKFTIGVGKLSAVRMDLAAHYIDIVKNAEGFNELDKEVVAELELFILLYRGIVEEHISAKQLPTDLSKWHTINSSLFNFDESLELKFA
ncbi:hypothetical protein ACKAV7_007025, partial [Fusarium commune]